MNRKTSDPISGVKVDVSPYRREAKSGVTRVASGEAREQPLAFVDGEDQPPTTADGTALPPGRP